MTLFNTNLRNISIVFFIATALISCTTINQFTPSTQIILQKEDFTIEGKFKIKINSIRENGYFLLRKQNNTVNLTLGKNYFLPERELTFDYKDLVMLSELINTEQSNFNYKLFPQDLRVEQLISLILGKTDLKQIDSWYIYYPQGIKEINGFQVPQKTLLVSGDSSIEFILKKFSLI